LAIASFSAFALLSANSFTIPAATFFEISTRGNGESIKFASNLALP
jgi:hypothetical protein